MEKVAVVTGGSSGIGLYICKALKEKGLTVYELSRRDQDVRGIIHIPCDITDDGSVAAAFAKIEEERGRADIVINNAGFGISGAAEFADEKDVRKLMDVNFFGALKVIKRAVPLMRKNGGGRIVNTSSVAAVASIPFQAFYSVSKAAINSLTLSLANELKDFGISVCAVMPGDTKTGFTDAREKNISGNEIYGEKIKRSVEKMEKDERGGMSAERAGRYIAKISTRKKVKPLYAIGISYKLITVLIKIPPTRTANYIIGILYT